MTVQAKLNNANPNNLAAEAQRIQFGDVVAALAPRGGASGLSTSGWLEGVAVSSHTVTLTTAGRVVSVEATTATSAGPKTKRRGGTVAAGEVTVTYNDAGYATLTFNATDAVTVCAVDLLAVPASLAVTLASEP